MSRSTPQIEIRPAGDADVDALATVGVESFTATYADTSTPEDIAAHLDANFRAAAVRREMALPDRHYLLAAVAGRPAGLIKLREQTAPASVPDRDAIEIQLLYVLPRDQRYGLGGRLVAAARDFALERSVRSLWLSAWESADWALNFYRKVGFQAVGKQGFRVGGTEYTDLVMWLPID